MLVFNSGTPGFPAPFSNAEEQWQADHSLIFHQAKQLIPVVDLSEPNHVFHHCRAVIYDLIINLQHDHRSVKPAENQINGR